VEPMQELNHPGDERLASFLDPELGPEELERLAAHLDICSVCEARLEKMEPAFSQYRRCLGEVHARVARSNLDPRTRDPWAKELWTKMERLEATRSARRTVTMRFAWLSGVAAAAIVVAFLVPWGGQSEIRADTLLARAATSVPRNTRPSRLRIRTRTALFVRPAAIRGGAASGREEAAIQERFVAAHYDWQEPLSVQSYRDWRRSLKQKTSKVLPDRDERTGQPEQRVETTTIGGELLDASLSLDASLAPVSGLFRFADQEWVEITIAPDPVPHPSSVVLAGTPVASPQPETSASPAGAKGPSESIAMRELSVRLAIDALNLGAGNPLEVTVEPAGAIVVTSYGLGPELEKQLRAGLEPIQGVTLRSAENGKLQDVAPRPVDQADRILRASQDASYEAHFLAVIANRFPPDAEAGLSGAGKTRLLDLRKKHSDRMVGDLAELRSELEKERSGFRPASADLSMGVQVQRMAQSATAVDRLITILFAGKIAEGAQAESWRELETQLGMLQSLSGAYSGDLDRSLARQ
jgi:hypothetical protein